MLLASLGASIRWGGDAGATSDASNSRSNPRHNFGDVVVALWRHAIFVGGLVDYFLGRWSKREMNCGTVGKTGWVRPGPPTWQEVNDIIIILIQRLNQKAGERRIRLQDPLEDA